MTLIPFSLPLARCASLYLPGSERLLRGYVGAIEADSGRGWYEAMYARGGVLDERGVHFPARLRSPLSHPAVRDHVVRVLSEGERLETCDACRGLPWQGTSGGCTWCKVNNRPPLDLAWAARHPAFGGPSPEVSAFVLAVTWARVETGLGAVRGVAANMSDGPRLCRWWAHTPNPATLYGPDPDLLAHGYALLDNDTLTALVPADSWLAKESP